MIIDSEHVFLWCLFFDPHLRYCILVIIMILVKLEKPKPNQDSNAMTEKSKNLILNPFITL